MRIDGIPGAPQPIDDNNKGKRSSKVEKYPGDAFSHTRGKGVDFETFIEVLNTSMKGENVREKRVMELKELVRSGKYSVDTDKLAKKMIDSMGGKI
ncbi:flagellar biosynthesis anti-sigma factor FlgM [Mesoaciditoga lauensis]|uniref:flagellar biosynthesis anti-sigma factor FlgM n=1 Tax=Mesoaciditoga lauensis TaxID=1495039 RepID=UPI000562C191|nr:flagellar biosynthesis anti-sigma factor FlgM [Mesoaciditoga lauensis]